MGRVARILLIAAAIIVPLLSHAQTDIQLTQYWAVPTYYNPAAAGTTEFNPWAKGANDYLRIRGGTQLQWVGIKNAPVGFLASADMPVKIGKQKLGVGVNIMQESLGLFQNLELNIQAAYKLKLLKGELSIGVQGGYFNQKFKGTEVYIPDDDDYHESTDQGIPTQDLTGYVFDLSAGVYYTHKHWYAGIGGLHLLEPTVKMSIEGSESTETQEYESIVGRMVYFTGGGNIRVSNSLFEMQPSLLVKTDFRSFTAEATLRAVYNKFLSFGIGYRYNDAVYAMIGGEYKNFFLGYSYDYSLSPIMKVSSGGHGIIAGYRLKLDFNGKNKNRHRSIRYM